MARSRRSTNPGHGARTGALLLVLLATALFAPRARAQTPSPLQEWQYSSGILLRQMFEPHVPTWRVLLGVSGSVAPLYAGAAPYHVRPGPAIDIRYRNLAFFSMGAGLGVNVLRGDHYRAGIAIAYDLGRQVSEYPSHLHGLGDINPAPVVKLFAAYAISKSFPLVIRADVRRIIGGADGWVGDLGLYMPLPGSSKRFMMFAGPSVTLASGSYMQTVFGVSASQAAASGYPRYDAQGGLKATGFGFSTTWFITHHWLLNADTAVSRLLGDAADSPITQRQTQGTLDLTVAYVF